MKSVAAASIDVAKPIVSLRNVEKSFGTLQVLNGVTFEVLAGKVAVLIGRSGSGKSTALRCINGLELAQQGVVNACGHVVNKPGTDLRKIRLDVGMVFQSYNLFPHLTVMENIMLAPRRVRKVEKQVAIELAEASLAQVGLSDKRHSYPEQLSGGQQQRAAIARALAMKPRVLLLDEVTSALDPELTGEVLKVIEQLASSGKTMIMVTHEMGFARRVADQVVFMHKGTVWESGTPAIMTEPSTEELRNFIKSEM